MTRAASLLVLLIIAGDGVAGDGRDTRLEVKESPAAVVRRAIERLQSGTSIERTLRETGFAWFIAEERRMRPKIGSWCITLTVDDGHSLLVSFYSEDGRWGLVKATLFRGEEEIARPKTVVD